MMELKTTSVLRKGTLQLFSILKSRGHDVSIYATSYRGEFYVRLLFYFHGLSFQKFVNQEKNSIVLQKLHLRPFIFKHL